MTLWYNAVDNTLHDDMDGAAIGLGSWPVGMTIATDAQIQAVLNPTKSSKQIALEKILALESKVTDRRIREAILGIDNGWLKSINDEIVVLRTQL